MFSHRNSPIRKTDGWFTCKNYLTDDLLISLWNSPTDIVGVRFGPKTKYCLLDIDIDSPHHPRNSNNLRNILGCLEDVGLIDPVPIQSSDSGGLHIYYFLPEQVPTFGLASLLSNTLISAGFDIKKGHLEIFPNPKRYVDTENHREYSQYNGHRLPLQQGSYLLDNSYNPYSDSIKSFDTAVETSSKSQDLDLILKWIEFYKNNPKFRKKSSKKLPSILALWREDFRKISETGWTGFHQTNALLCSVSKYIVVFTDLSDSEQLSEMLRVVTNLPGYKDYCRHQHEIEVLCRDWLTSSRRYYWRYGTDSKRKPNTTFKKAFEPVLANIKVEESAKSRLLETLTHLRGQVFPSVCSLFRAVVSKAKCLFNKGFSNRTLYKYQELWESLVNPEVIAENSKLDSSPPKISSKSENPETLIEKPLPTPPPINECLYMQSGSVPDPTQEKLNLSSPLADRLAPGFFCKFLLHCLENVQKLRSSSEKSLPFGLQAFAVCLCVGSFPSIFLSPVFVQNNIAAVEDNVAIVEHDVAVVENDITVIENDVTLTDITAVENDITTIENDITAVKHDITVIENDVTLTDITAVESDITAVKHDITAIENDITLTDVTTVKHDITAVEDDIALTDITAVENDVTLTDITNGEDDVATIEDDVYLDEDDIYFSDDGSFQYLL